jgi:site-specific recombinase XerD
MQDIENFIAQFIDAGRSSGTIAEKIYSLNTFYRYYCRKKLLSSNPVEFVEAPVRVNIPIIKLSQNEVQKLLSVINNETRKRVGMRRISEKLLLRDRTMLVMFLSSGIRISELVGLDIKDINIEEASFIVLGKGGNYETIYMTNELIEQLKIYLKKLNFLSTDEPLFRNYLGFRLHTKCVQDLVKQYAKWAEITKRVTPHTLRRTFGTQLYRETRDIYLVSKVLRHTEVKVTTKHYADCDDDIKKNTMRDYRIA